MSASRRLRRTVAAASKSARRRAPGRTTQAVAATLARARSLTALTWAVAAALMAVGALILALVLSSGGKPTVDNGRYLSLTGCLLTDSHGLSGQPAAAAWAGLQKAATATRIQAQYLQVPVSATSATPYLASLIVRHCSVVIAAGPAPAAAVQAAAHRYRNVRFVVVGGSASGPNVTVVNGPAQQVTTQVDAQVTDALSTSK